MGYLLEGVKVIDAATFLAGPGAATVLADFGANVIKIEPPGGDGYRALKGPHPVEYHWLLTSRGKRSVCLDLKSEAGQVVLHQLVTDADVLITNYLDPQLERFGMRYEQLRELNPKLVFAQLTGYGTEGPETQRKAFDITAWWARSGLMEFIRDKGQTPLAAAPGMGDHATATALFGAIMTGLYRREKTGEGCHVSTSLAANGVWANGMALQGVIAGLDLGAIKQDKGWHNPFTSAYPSADGKYVVLAIINREREWPQLAKALGREDWLEDPRFADRQAQMDNRYALIAAIGAETARFDQEALMTLLDQHAITCGRVQPMGDVVHDEQLRANEIIVATGDDDEHYQWTVGSPIRIREETKQPPRRAPNVGQHTREVLREAGLDERQIESLIAAGVVTEPQEHPNG